MSVKSSNNIIDKFPRVAVDLEIDEAIELLKNESDVFGEPVQFKIGLLFEQKKNYIDALKWYEKASERMPLAKMRAQKIKDMILGRIQIKQPTKPSFCMIM